MPIASFPHSKFPPRIVKSVYGASVRKCLEQSGAKQEQIDEFNDAEDLNHLPSDRTLKCYMHCQLVEMDMMESDQSATVFFHKVVNGMQHLQARDQNIYLRMGSRCSMLKYHTNDPCEAAYIWNACLKKSDINVNYIEGKTKFSELIFVISGFFLALPVDLRT